MTGTVVLATHNQGKVVELREILGDALGSGVELQGYDGPEPVEDGDTYAANALIKARAAVAHTGLPALADDSGIAVDALGGAPGIHSARYAGTRVDADNIDLLLRNLDGVVERTAAFVCAAAFVTPGGVEHVVEAVWNGEVLTERRGDGGHGYDPVFQPDDADRSSAELTRAEKNALSHRAKAFRGIAPIVREWFDTTA
ncbi:RdgB/HAM1 family non-canonical purine NTP pyrophosphatase [Curtobacterium sp. MCLR17_007]|uniref:RdgB/HAM1 family non-canonical purine NTP pyrophosphatase n=1 Tax=unclassified Curtobacterium TaxID=257496 RepID=UPI0006F40CBA|nr:MULTISPECIES: RdgB/HAM1 family non-canonical purine NTP pyrophosphatase [unclassified Curtobacterium]KQS08816.1 non-canonical purine NTP pyrophosphatase [Curtobacterium sp. Leaf183]WIB61174.1 RdgB/HAM1 family non-canonical purine NTP pyrophosphatase [Curtobacterium sp. MCLR17_007]